MNFATTGHKYGRKKKKQMRPFSSFLRPFLPALLFWRIEQLREDFDTAQTDEGEPTSDRNLNTHYAEKRQFRSNRAKSERTVLYSFRRSSPLSPDSWLLLVAASPRYDFLRLKF
jgi:hypothetical protein